MIETPCIGVCMINPELEQCMGCARTLNEIATWAAYTPAERSNIINQLPARREALDKYIEKESN